MKTTFAPSYPPVDDKTGIYVHVPFCKSRCRYCGFVTNLHHQEWEERYLRDVIREMELWRERIDAGDCAVSDKVDTLYFGGGTPSLLRQEQLIGILAAFRRLFRIASDAEVTLEINPATVDRSALRTLRKAGFNRASLGIQSLLDSELQAMGRPHSARGALDAFRDLRATGFDNLSADLLSGFPGQTRESVARTLQGIVDLKPEHISVYLLEAKAGTPLSGDIDSGRVSPPDDDLAADLYEDVCGALSDAGYDQYEISNFSRPGRVARHNLKYWQDRIFLGFGPGAHGMTGRNRYAHVDALDAYSSAIGRGRLPIAWVAELTPETRFKEALIMGLRLVSGLDLSLLGRRYGVDARSFVLQTAGDLIAIADGDGGKGSPWGWGGSEGAETRLAGLRGDMLALTARGRLLSNVIFRRWV
jgi:oxygen-independent coproporphyrinogen III oxidase